MTDHAEALAKALEELAAERRCTAVMAGRANRAEAELAAYRSRPAAEVVVKPLIDYIDAIDAHDPTRVDFPDERFVAHGNKVGGFTFGDLRRVRSALATPALAGTEPAGEVVEGVFARMPSRERMRNKIANSPDDDECEVRPAAALRDQSEA